jgi:hypothetical protein
MSVIDLVIRYQELEPSHALREATAWLCARWTVPTVAKNTKLARRERWATSPVGRSSFPLEEFIRSGVWAALDDPARAVLPVLFCFAERGTVSVSYRGLARYSGLRSLATVSKGFQQLKRIGILEALPRLAGSNFREPSTYRFTFDSEKFQAALSETHARLKLESGAERVLLAQSKIHTLPETPTPTHPESGAYPGTVFTDSVTRTQVHVTANEACTFSHGSNSDPISEDLSTENKDTCESSRFNPCNTNSAELPTQIPEVTSPASDSQDSDIESKTACTSARFNSCNTKRPSSTDFDFGWNAPAARGVN